MTGKFDLIKKVFYFIFDKKSMILGILNEADY